MADGKLKQMTMTVFEQEFVRNNWFYDFDGESFEKFCKILTRDMRKLGIALKVLRNRNAVVKIDSYADLLNVVRISSVTDNHCNQCVGHIIGKSEHLDILEDIGVAVRRLAFAPETVPPSGEFRKVCHNCGCGC